MPEVDGLIGPVFYAGGKLARDGTKKSRFRSTQSMWRGG
jgi:hypothetical protein